MIGVPMDNAGQGYVVAQLFERDFDAGGPKTNGFGRLTQAQKIDAGFGNKAPISQILKRKCLSVVFGNHAQAGWSTIHGIQLRKVRERFH